MGRRRKGRDVHGIVLIDKPQGASSNNILQKVRAIYNASKAGHTGALDPLATGMLPVCLGEATKFSQFLLDSDKTYFVTAKLGQRTDTSDADGELIETHDVDVSEQEILHHKQSLTGEIMQVPTMFSALKHQGKPLYWYARQGITVERDARPIKIFRFELTRFEGDEADFEVHCSKGTYIRTLIDDLGQLLGCGAHVKVLRRTQVADYPYEKMLTLERVQALKDDNIDDNGVVDPTSLDAQLLPMDTAVKALPSIKLSMQQIKTLRFGQTLPTELKDCELLRAYNEDNGEFIGVVSIVDGEIKSSKLVVTSDFL